MRAIVAEEFGGYQNLKLADIPKPAVSDGRVLVRMTCRRSHPARSHHSLWKLSNGKSASRAGQRRGRRCRGEPR